MILKSLHICTVIPCYSDNYYLDLSFAYNLYYTPFIEHVLYPDYILYKDQDCYILRQILRL